MTRDEPRILMISSFSRCGGSGGGERTLSIYRALSRLASVHFLLLHDAKSPPELEEGDSVIRLFDPDGPWIRRRRRALLQNFRPEPRIARFVAELHRRMRFSAFLGRYFSAVMTGMASLGPSAIDLDDLDPEDPDERNRLAQRARRQIMSIALRRYRTLYVPRASDLSFVRHPRAVVLPCISTQARRLPEAEGPPRMLFAGGAGFEVNRDGVGHFVQACLPTILKRMPEARLAILGDQWDHLRGVPGVEVMGFVQDLAAEYARAQVCICPTRKGTGAKVKLAEALGFGRATVATPHAAAGFTGLVTPGRDLLVEERDQGFAEACVALLQDPARRRALAEKAAHAAARNLSQTAIDRIVADTFELSQPAQH